MKIKTTKFAVINASIAVAVALSAGVAAIADKWQKNEYKENLQAQRVVIVNTPSETEQIESVLPSINTEETINSINAGYAEIWEEQQNETPKAESPELRYALTDEERTAIEQIVASEGGYCDYEFQALVATCILNGCEAEGMRPLEIFARGDFWLTHNVAPTETTKQAVSDVFDLGVLPTEEKVRYYYNPNYCTSALHESMCYVLTSSDCRFFKDWE